MEINTKKLQQNAFDTIGKRVFDIIQAVELNEHSFAKQLGKTNAVISNIVHGRNAPGLETILGIILVFNVNPFFLLLGQGDMFGAGKPSEEERETINYVLKMMNENITKVREEAQRDKNELYKQLDMSRNLLTKHKIIG